MSDIADRVKKIVVEHLGVDEAKVTESASFVDDLGADSLFYLPLEAVARCIGLPQERLCRACITGQYPTPTGERLYQLALINRNGAGNGRTYELATQASG